MPMPQPTESVEFPFYPVDAKCPSCGKEGRTRSFVKYPDGTTIDACCTECIDKHEAVVQRCERRRIENATKSRQSARPTETDPQKPRERKPHWTEKLP